MPFPHLHHRPQNIIPRRLLHHFLIRKHASIPADVLEFLRHIAVRIPHPETRDMRDVQFPRRIVRHAMTAGFIVRPRPMHRAVVLRHMKINRPRP